MKLDMVSLWDLRNVLGPKPEVVPTGSGPNLKILAFLKSGRLQECVRSKTGSGPTGSENRKCPKFAYFGIIEVSGTSGMFSAKNRKWSDLEVKTGSAPNLHILVFLKSVGPHECLRHKTRSTTMTK